MNFDQTGKKGLQFVQSGLFCCFDFQLNLAMYKIYQQIIDQVAQKIDAPKQVHDEQIIAALLDDLVHRLEDIEEGDERALMLGQFGQWPGAAHFAH